MIKGNEAESWETKYRELLNRVKGTPEYETAKNIPHRSRIGRTAEKREKAFYFLEEKRMSVFLKCQVI